MRNGAVRRYLGNFIAALSVAVMIIVATILVVLPKNNAKNANANYQPNAVAGDQKNGDTLLGLSPEDWTAIFTAVLALFTIVLSLSTAGLWIVTWRSEVRQSRHSLKAITLARRSADVAEKALIAANRPWIKVDIQVGGPIFYNVNGVNFTLKYILQNIGHSPATNVWVSPRAVYPILSEIEPRHLSPRDEMQKVISHLKTRPPSPLGFALFPNDIIIQDITVSISQDEIKRTTQLIEAIYPVIVGAVDYRIDFDEKSHQTGFTVEIRRSNFPRPATTAKNRAPEVIWVDEGDIPAEEVRLFRSFIHGGYAD